MNPMRETVLRAFVMPAHGWLAYPVVVGLLLFVAVAVRAAELVPPAWEPLVIRHESFDSDSGATNSAVFCGGLRVGAWTWNDPAVSPHVPRTFSFWWAFRDDQPDTAGVNWLRIQGPGRGFLGFFSRGKGKWCALQEPAGVLQVWYVDGVPGVSVLDRRFSRHCRFKAGVWHHTAVVVSGGRRVRVYVDGQLWREALLKGRGLRAEHALHALTVGPIYGDPGRLMIDEVLVLNRALAADSIRTYYLSMRAFALRKSD